MDCSKVTFPVLGRSYTFCTGATFADLTTTVGGNERWYDDPIGGTAHSNDENVSAGTYYAEEFVGSCINQTRYPVSVTLGPCTRIGTAQITTFVNVMYDFQHQQLEAYTTGGIPTNYQWQFSTSASTSTFVNITDAPNSNFYNIPAHFADNYPTALTNGLYFRCLLSNPATPTPLATSSINILFIKTEDVDGTPVGNYNREIINGDTVRYLTVKRGANGDNNGATTTGTMKIALLNLGESQNRDGSYNNDAGDLGDLYQWGRIKDGHEHIVWSKAADHTNTIEPASGGIDFTSAVLPTGATSYTSTGQIQEGAYGYGSFLTMMPFVSWNNNGILALWGNGTDYQRSDLPWTYPDYQANNPCPSGWYVPSSCEFWDIYRGDGTDDGFTGARSSNLFTGTVNTWSPHPAVGDVFGGFIITNKSGGESVFLPWIGSRDVFNGKLYSNASGYLGLYWLSSTNTDTTSGYALDFWSAQERAVSNQGRVSGGSVRCVK